MTWTYKFESQDISIPTIQSKITSYFKVIARTQTQTDTTQQIAFYSPWTTKIVEVVGDELRV